MKAPTVRSRSKSGFQISNPLGPARDALGASQSAVLPLQRPQRRPGVSGSRNRLKNRRRLDALYPSPPLFPEQNLLAYNHQAFKKCLH
jgi:hypothetical protein